MFRVRLLAALSCGLTIGVSLPALARRAALPLDPSLRAEHVLYSKLHAEERFGIKFQPYASVRPVVAHTKAQPHMFRADTPACGNSNSSIDLGDEVFGYIP